MNLDPIYVFTCTCTLVILDNCWFWDSISAIPHLRALFILAKTHSFLFPRILSNHINLLCHTSIIALAKLYNLYIGGKKKQCAYWSVHVKTTLKKISDRIASKSSPGAWSGICECSTSLLICIS